MENTTQKPAAPPEAIASPDFSRRTKIILIILAMIVGYSFSVMYPIGSDYELAFRHAAENALEGRNPYIYDDLGKAFISPPHTLLLFMPFALLPEVAGWSLWLTLSFALMQLVILHFAEGNGLRLLVMWVSPLLLFSLMLGNFDNLTLLGFIVHPAIGLPLALLKPHIGLMAIVITALEAREQQNWKPFLAGLATSAVVIIGGFIFYPDWLTYTREQADVAWNAASAPYTIPTGLMLMLLAAVRREPRQRRLLGITGLLLCSPYVGGYSYFPIVWMIKRPLFLLLASSIFGTLLTLIFIYTR